MSAFVGKQNIRAQSKPFGFWVNRVGFAVARLLPVLPDWRAFGARSACLKGAAAEVASSLFDHLVGTGKQRLGNLHANCLGGSGVDEKYKFRRLLDRQFNGARSLENLST
jgi:hypothetical protein